jgi:hypothetical protein
MFDKNNNPDFNQSTQPQTFATQNQQQANQAQYNSFEPLPQFPSSQPINPINNQTPILPSDNSQLFKAKSAERPPIGLFIITGFWAINFIASIINFSNGTSNILTPALGAFIVFFLIILIITRKSIAMTCVIVPTLFSAVTVIFSFGANTILRPQVLFSLLSLAFKYNPFGTSILLLSLFMGVTTPFYLSHLRKKGFVVK